MTAYNFSPQFVPLIESGRKMTTFRVPRKHPPREGGELQLYTGMRTKQCRLIMRAQCMGIVHVHLRPYISLSSGRTMLTMEEQETIAREDGFGSVREFHAWFADRYGQERMELEVVAWSPSAYIITVSNLIAACHAAAKTAMENALMRSTLLLAHRSGS